MNFIIFFCASPLNYFLSVFVKPWWCQCCAYASLANTGGIGGLCENKEEFIKCLLVMLIYTLHKLWFCRSCTKKSKAGEHYSTDIDTRHTREVCIIILPGWRETWRRNVTLLSKTACDVLWCQTLVQTAEWLCCCSDCSVFILLDHSFLTAVLYSGVMGYIAKLGGRKMQFFDREDYGCSKY